MATFITPGEGTVEATFESLRASLAMESDYRKKGDFQRAAILAKQVRNIAKKMVENADESVRYSVERHIEDILLGKC